MILLKGTWSCEAANYQMSVAHMKEESHHHILMRSNLNLDGNPLCWDMDVEQYLEQLWVGE